MFDQSKFEVEITQSSQWDYEPWFVTLAQEYPMYDELITKVSEIEGQTLQSARKLICELVANVQKKRATELYGAGPIMVRVRADGTVEFHEAMEFQEDAAGPYYDDYCDIDLLKLDPYNETDMLKVGHIVQYILLLSEC